MFTTLDMDDHINIGIILVHVGANSLRGRERSSKCADEIISLAKSIKSKLPDTTIAISSLKTPTQIIMHWLPKLMM
jgi:hypothetical protein